MDDLDLSEGELNYATITGITVYAYVRYAEGGPNCHEAVTSGVVDIGFRTSTAETGTIELWKGNTNVDGSGNYNLISYSYGGSLVPEHINNLQVFVKRLSSGSSRMRVTEVYVKVDYKL
jgi:hypothetical protein